MADLLVSLEAGMTRTVGAASRLRNQVKEIDSHMAALRQVESFAATFAPQNGPVLAFTHSQNHNIDPSLQGTGLPVSGVGGFAPNAFGFPPGVNGMGGGQEQFQFQVPLELREGYPWNFNIAQRPGQHPN